VNFCRRLLCLKRYLCQMSHTFFEFSFKFSVGWASRIFGAVADAAHDATPAFLSGGAVAAPDPLSLTGNRTVAPPAALCTCALDGSRPAKRLRLNHSGASVSCFPLRHTLTTHNSDRFHPLLCHLPLSRRRSHWDFPPVHLLPLTLALLYVLHHQLCLHLTINLIELCGVCLHARRLHSCLCLWFSSFLFLWSYGSFSMVSPHI
jgi:hypothetical protein